MSLTIACTPSEFRVAVITPYAKLRRARIDLFSGDDHTLGDSYDLKVLDAVNSTDSTVTYVLPVSDALKTSLADGRTKILSAESARAGTPSGVAPAPLVSKLGLEFDRVPSIDFQSIEVAYAERSPDPLCRTSTLVGEELRARVEPEARLVRMTLLQEKLSDAILRGNEWMANLLIAALVLSFFWLLSYLSDGIRSVYLISDQALKERVLSLVPISSPDRHKEVEKLLRSRYGEMRRRLALARVLGPAMGFLLTVSSLIAGLHPSVTSVQDTFRFVSALQLALVATFMGLLVRVVAEFALRLQYDASEREIRLIS